MSALIQPSAKNAEGPRKGFSLIELLVAISIIAIISTVGLITYSQAQMLARDAKRKQDLKAIAFALEIYKQKNGRYPCHGDYANSTDPTSFWITDSDFEVCDPSATAPKVLDTNYINSMPNDPKSNDGRGDPEASSLTYYYGYSYRTPTTCNPPYPTTTGQFYRLETKLENKNDPDTCKVKQYKSCDNLSVCPTPDSDKEKLFVITSQ